MLKSKDQTLDWIDFEAGDEIETAERLLEMGVNEDVLVDQEAIRHATLDSANAAQSVVHNSARWKPDIVIINGMLAFSLFDAEASRPVDSMMVFRQGVDIPAYSARVLCQWTSFNLVWCRGQGVVGIQSTGLPDSTT